MTCLPFLSRSESYVGFPLEWPYKDSPRATKVGWFLSHQTCFVNVKNILSINITSPQNQPTSKPPRKIPLCRYACFGVSRNRLKREVGASGRLLQTARVGRLDAGRYCFACAAFNMAGCSSPVSVTVDPAVTRRVICVNIYIYIFFLFGGGWGGGYGKNRSNRYYSSIPIQYLDIIFKYIVVAIGLCSHLAFLHFYGYVMVWGNLSPAESSSRIQ